MATVEMDPDTSFHLVSVAELTGHDDRVWNVAWNPTKPLLATCSADKTVRLYSYAEGADSSPAFALHTSISTGHNKTVRALAWSPSGIALATASFDANIGIWQREGEEEAGEEEAGGWECMALLEGHETECKSVAWSASGNLLASCSRDKTVWVWEAGPDHDFECMGVLMEHTQDVKAVAWHPHEEILASASYDDTIKLYIDDPSEDWFCFATLSGHTSTVWSLAWSPDGRYLASASDDCTIRVWKRVGDHEWVCVSILEGHDRTIYGVSWGVGKKGTDDNFLGWVASAGGDGRINVWELTESANATSRTPPDSKLIARIENAHGVADINSIAWSPRKGYEDFLATTGDDGTARVWRMVNVER
ncbi:hypothetical protein HETIRDRAFT_412162 [Heterobasidion irregulare TC 32-1]|uniref:Probable cytosolic iron-sulfur protein assembly protein 1 n=1 Tax=Heterobasidion irregulare (strain TC 32-1) TaxID=747525 RepID=W4JRT4_HETIT|nr:uncharacterized protein HETIRDRAFT_412162 [Heterobasidion irregulare TC 32-1]ETW75790.1 hypothetical protein HETIRDRAFT_412162 [Heterobasidion irregulare TC 32-1]